MPTDRTAQFVKIDWKGLEFQKLVRRGMTKNLTAAGRALKAEVKRVISVSGRTVSFHTTRTGNVKKTLGAKGSSPSEPGEPPHKQTGRLIRSLFSKLANRGKAVRVGGKGAALEYGTRKMAARPFLRSTLAKMQSQLASILTRPIN